MKIGDVNLGERPVTLAPMEDVTDASFRILCREAGAAMVTTEFVSSDGLVRDVQKTIAKMHTLEEESFSSTVRLAKSNADMWVPILTQNHDNVLQVMDTYIEKMKAFREAVADYDEDKIRELINEANKIKKILR